MCIDLKRSEETLGAELSGFGLKYQRGTLADVSRAIPVVHMDVGDQGRGRNPGYKERARPGKGCKVKFCTST